MRRKMFVLCLVLLLLLPFIAGVACSGSDDIGHVAEEMRLADKVTAPGTDCGLLGALGGGCGE